MVVGGCIGSATFDGDGRICLYESDDLYNWKYKGNVLESNGKLGTMMECPDMFELNGKWVVTCSPMNHPDYNKSLYCVGTMDFENCIYTIEKWVIWMWDLIIMLHSHLQTKKETEC